MDLKTAVVVSGTIAAIGITLNTAELWQPSPRFSAFFDWRIVGVTYQATLRSSFARSLITIAAHPKAMQISIFAQVVSAWLFVLFAWTGLYLAQFLSAAVVSLGLCHLHFRLVVGLDGSDQMQVILWTVLGLVSAGEASLVTTTALGFLVAQVVLSYLISGIAKLVSPIWREGDAVRAIVSTREYGTRWIQQILRVLPASRLLCWLVILFEVGGPILLFTGMFNAYVFVAAGLGFHAANWAVMGLRSFVFAFVGTYPLILYAVEAWL
jgi:hypothetical protein